MSSPENNLMILSKETQRLEQYLNGLPPESWEQPSACELWTVADVVAHLTHTNKVYAPRVVRALEGDAAPDNSTYTASQGEVGATYDGWRAERAITLRKELGDRLLSEYVNSNDAILGALGRVGPQDWDKMAYRARGAEPIRNIADMLLLETVIHGWDIRSHLSAEANLSPDALPVIIERQPQRPTFSAEFADTSSPLLRCRFLIAAPHDEALDVVLTEKRSYMELHSQEVPNITFRCDAETFVLLTYGRINASEVIANGKLSFNGAPEAATSFFQRFPRG